MKNFLPGSVRTIFTLATPHAAPPAPLDWDLAALYRRLHNLWAEDLEAGSDPFQMEDVTLISIAGGTHDTMISSALTEIVKVLSRALFDTLDATRPEKTIPRAERMKSFVKQFLSGITSDIGSISVSDKDPHYALKRGDNGISLTDASSPPIRSEPGQASQSPLEFRLVNEGFMMLTMGDPPEVMDIEVCTRNASTASEICSQAANLGMLLPGGKAGSTLRFRHLNLREHEGKESVKVRFRQQESTFLLAQANAHDVYTLSDFDLFGTLDTLIPIKNLYTM
ncbi:GPI inositol-deacylase, partial [Thoreauomyces humboldtii]